MWKPQYEANRRKKEKEDPEYAARIRSQRSRTPEENVVYMKEYYETNKTRWQKRNKEQRDKINATRREKYATDAATRTYYLAISKEWQRNNPEKRKSQRIKKYGLTLIKFEALLVAQNGKCAICGFSDRSNRSVFPLVDHCHATGKVRGLLCAACNHGIGKFRDDPKLLRAAIKYLGRPGVAAKNIRIGEQTPKCERCGSYMTNANKHVCTRSAVVTEGTETK